MAEETQQIPTYKLGERIQIKLNVHDESGVAGVVAFFRLKQDPTKSIRLVGSGDGKVEAVVTLDTTITEEIAPGEYVCDWIELVDIKGNRTIVANPDIAFRVEDVPGDHEGPELRGVQVISPESIPSRESVGEPSVRESTGEEA